jgi:DNA-binding winged helix-turn-helix (wHTH) protein
VNQHIDQDLLELDRINGSSASAISFGPFRLLAGQRLLLDGDRPVRLGSRALDILIALTERPGELVSKRELMAVVWPETVVVDANLTVHVAALRRALSDGQAGNRYIVNVPGRGYRFVSPVTFVDERPVTPRLAAALLGHSLPAQLTRLIGRAEIVDNLAQQLPAQCLLTIVGPGGIGKTAVALDVAKQLLGAFEDGIWLIDLEPIADSRLASDDVRKAKA